MKESHGPLSLSHSSKQQSNLTREKHYKNFTRTLDISHLDQILQITSSYAIVEPRVTMDELARATLPLGLIPKVLPEFKGITVGGAIMGAALESSSHRYGQFNDCCQSFEVLLGNGEVVHASHDLNSDLFYGLSGSYGTLGLILAADIPLVKAHQWVQLHYILCSSLQELNQKLQIQSAPFVEGIMLSKDCGVIIVGEGTDHPTVKKSHLYPWGPWFYDRSFEDVAIPFYEYLFRHDRGAFWIGSYLSDLRWIWKYYFGTLRGKPRNTGSFNRLVPFLFGSFLSSQRLYKTLHTTDEKWVQETFVIQDFYLPRTKVEEFVQAIPQIYPLWFCPIKATQKPQILAPHLSNEEMLVDVGIYGVPLGMNAINVSKNLEKHCQELGGRKMLYAHSYYDEKAFWSIYDRRAYEALRTKYKAQESLLTITNKIF